MTTRCRIDTVALRTGRLRHLHRDHDKEILAYWAIRHREGTLLLYVGKITVPNNDFNDL